MKFFSWIGLLLVVLCLYPPSLAQAKQCYNPGKIRYHKGVPGFFAPESKRALGFYVEADSLPKRPPDLRPECLPLPIRYNNPGALQTPRAGPWSGQTGRDAKGHAVFQNLEDGVAAWLLWVKRRAAAGTNTAYKLMSMYAPPNDCIGSVDKLSNGQCPRRFPLNDTIGYANRVSLSFGVGPNDRLTLSGETCAARKGLKTFFTEVMKVELGNAFCNGVCKVDDAVFDAAANQVFGVNLNCHS